MFKKFTKEDISSQTSIKSSAQRAIRASLLKQCPLLSQPSEEPDTPLLEYIWPKKENITLVKCRDHLSIYALHGEPLWFQHFDGPLFPTLRLVHKYPNLLPHVGIDRGAIKFLLSGASMMCPGLTSPGGFLPLAESLIPEGTVVAIMAEGKEHAAGVGIMKLDSEEVKKVNKGVAVESVTYLGDDLWGMKTI
ncbi:hypothetical protein DACRYDRAFT_20096 [Dacryopinax primogenitus]|uniref:Translation machinery-associated protein 20 n=1 Tax=Dacryopinax primogenitus (strain DJM 731) TaxID=1858805 RepID=M5GEU6_DACPD|nr:uncharacterized protein DACRYDRAFT_20096 [Dacryopinax primogenitus]EJU05687.1 hypothetical protein DACRYDRAFT_20096 [Dacryopinax primogenitus]